MREHGFCVPSFSFTYGLKSQQIVTILETF